MRFDILTRKATTNEDKKVLIISDSKYITPPKRMRRFWMWIIASRKCKETTIASLTLLSVVCMLVVGIPETRREAEGRECERRTL